MRRAIHSFGARRPLTHRVTVTCACCNARDLTIAFRGNLDEHGNLTEVHAQFPRELAIATHAKPGESDDGTVVQCGGLTWLQRNGSDPTLVSRSAKNKRL